MVAEVGGRVGALHGREVDGFGDGFGRGEVAEVLQVLPCGGEVLPRR